MIEDLNTLKEAGQVSVFVVLGIMGLISSMYIKSLIKKLETLPNMDKLVERFDNLVFKVQSLCINYESKVESLEKRIQKLEDKVNGQ